MELNRWNRALITGASSGIGRAFAGLLAEQGTELVVVARDRERLERLAEEFVDAHGITVEVLAADLSDREQLGSVVDRLGAESPIDLLINNAGLGFAGDFIELDGEAEAAVVDVNVSAMHRLAHAAATAMSTRGRGGILNVSSVAGFGPSPRAATYAATKAFVTSLSEALHAELGPRGVVVTCLCPGLTRTEFHARAGMDPAETAPDALWQSADDVARAGLEGLARGRAVVVPGVHNKAYGGLLRMAPSGVVRRIGNLVASAADR